MGPFLKVRAAGLLPGKAWLRWGPSLRYAVQAGAGRARLLTLSGFFVFQIVEPEACDQMYESLARLHSNYYKHKVSGPQAFLSPAL